jgi:hypothetical protein
MISNDISYIYEDFPFPFAGTRDEAKTLIRQLLSKHLTESISAPFFNEADDLEDLKDGLPEGWTIELDEATKVTESTLRIVVYNKYEEADRSSGEDFETVHLRASNLYGYTWVITSVEVEEDKYDELPLELCSAEGESRVCILLYGGHDGELYADYDELDISFGDECVNISEESLDQVLRGIFWEE